MIYYSDLNSEEKKALEQKIDEAFKSTFLRPKEKSIIDFLKRIQNFEIDFGFGTHNKDQPTRVIDLFYSANCPLEFLFVEPCSDFYPDLDIDNRPELRFEYYDSYDIEELGKKVIDESNIDYSDEMDEEDFELEAFWENRGELETQFLIECWQKAKKESQTNMIGYLLASDSSGGPYFLDDTYHPWKSQSVDIEEHLSQLGIEL